MKLYLTILSVLSLALFSCQNYNNPVDSDLGKAKVKTESKYSVDINNSNISNILYKKCFDISGNVIDYEEYNPTGAIRTKSIFSYEELTSKEELKSYDASGNLSNCLTIISQYFDNGKIKEKQTLNIDGVVAGKEVYNYDSNWNLLRKVNYNLISGTQDLTEYAYKYNNSGALVERIINETGQFGTSYSRDSIAYRQQDNKFEIINYNALGNIVKIKTYYYNQNGLVSLEIESDGKGVVKSKYAYRYEFHN